MENILATTASFASTTFNNQGRRQRIEVLPQANRCKFLHLERQSIHKNLPINIW